MPSATTQDIADFIVETVKSAGANACPPEDCGGVWGYKDILEILGNPEHEEHADMLEWLCIENADEFDSGEFDPSAVVFESPEDHLAEWN